MQTIVKYFEKKFKAEESKESYLRACKWLANNIVSSKDLQDSLWKITKVEENFDYTIFKVELYCSINDGNMAETFCKACQEMHNSFFINEDYNCSRCNMVTFRKRLEESLAVKKAYRKERLKDILGYV